MFLSTPTTRPAPRRTAVAALLGAVVLGVLAAALPTGPALACLALALAAGALAAVLGLRDQWHAAAPQPAAAPRPLRTEQSETVQSETVQPETVLPETVLPRTVVTPAVRTELTGRLEALRAAYVGKVNSALDAGREDLVGELSDAYTEQALQLLTDGAPAPAAAADRPASRAPRASTFSTLVRRFDRYTLEAFRPAAPYRRELVHGDAR